MRTKISHEFEIGNIVKFHISFNNDGRVNRISLGTIDNIFYDFKNKKLKYSILEDKTNDEYLANEDDIFFPLNF